ncbi:hypothetical protein HKX48_006537 [Thoreauomyces humboldtii]|nr:hypothetical protein HKX48_006537 [Thoreauomyces humboldtii]
MFNAASTPRVEEMPFSLDAYPGTALWDKVRAHITRCATDIARDQKLLETQMGNMEEYCTKLANTVVNRCHEAKVQGDKLSALTGIKKQAERTGTALDDLLMSLEKLDPLLPETEQLGHIGNVTKYPALTKLLAARRAAEEAAERA